MSTDNQNASGKLSDSISSYTNSQRSIAFETMINDSFSNILANNTSDVYENDTNSFSYVELSDSASFDSSVVHDVSITPLTAHCHVVNLGLRGRGLHLGHLNVRGIRSGEKVDQIKLMLQSKENNITMLGVSESKLGSEIRDSFIQIQNFQCFRKDKMQGSGK